MKEILGIQMQIQTIWKEFEAFDCKFKPFERDSKHTNANSYHSNQIRSIRMQIPTIQTKCEAFECKFKPFMKFQGLTLKCKFEQFERDSKHLIVNLNRSNANSNNLTASLNNSKGIRSIQIQIRTIQKGFEALKCKFQPFERDSKHSNANSNY